MEGLDAVGIFGLGKMGKNIAFQMLGKGYKVIAYNRSEAPLKEASEKGAIPASSLSDLVGKLKGQRVVWVMLPAGEPTDKAVNDLSSLLSKEDIVIDGSNSKYTDSIRHSEILESKGIRYLDAGCSGGPSGALAGMCMMVGGDRNVYAKCESLFKDLSVKDGYAYMGKAGSGHFVKMVHNAIEYGMMQSIVEGADLLEKGPYDGLDLARIMKLWQNGSVVRSYLVELAGRALEKDPGLKSIEPYVEDSGEGRWAAQTAIELGVPLTALTHSIYERFSSRNGYQFSRRLLAALRHEFGGHETKKPD